MAAVLVDSNVLLDVLTDDEAWAGWSARALARAANSGRVVINPIVYGEVSMRFTSIEDLEAALPHAVLEKEPIPFEAAFLAGKAFTKYRSAEGSKIFPQPDVLVGAHAAVAGYQVLTRDPRRYLTYFPKLRLISPTT